ncbi:MAG: hypothetical protein RLZZ393_542 [Pseudomonadota bacterium]
MKAATLTNTAQQPASERELVDAMIRVANGSELEINGIVMPSPPTGFALPAEDLWGFGDSGQATPASWEAVWQSTVQKLRADLRDRLDEAMLAPDAAAARAVRTWHCQRVQTSLRLMPGGLRISTHYPVTSLADVCDTALALLLDVDRGFRDALCKCQLADCGRFFFVDRSRGNRPRTRYCSTEHMLAFHGGDRGAARVRKHRLNKTKNGAPGRS